nr:type III-A CRISPR-associated protein Csm2 [uncultured Desulfobulbus sp.]
MLDDKHELANHQALGKEHVVSWIKNGPDPKYVNEAEDFGRYLASELRNAIKKDKFGKPQQDKWGNTKTVDESVTTSQIRQVFSKLKTIEAKGFTSAKQRTEFMMLKPYFAYAAGRQNKTGLDRLKERVIWGIDAVLAPDSETSEEQRFYNFCKFFEAVLAYHRAAGGK